MRVAVIAVILAAASTASASPGVVALGDAIARHDDAALAALRAQLPGDADLRCALGAVYARRNDLPRADLYLAGCDAASLAPDIADAVDHAQRDTARALRDSELAGIDIDAHPDGLDAEVDALPGERFTVSRVVWVPAGHHVVRVYANGQPHDYSIDLKPRSRAPLTIHLDAPAAPAARTTTQNFGEDEPVEPTIEGSPPAVQHPPMKINVIDAHQAPGGDQIDDPFITHRTQRPVVFGVRVGGGVFAESYGPARFGPAVALVGSLALLARLHLDLRFDWTQRGSDGIDTIGATLGPTVTVWRPSKLSLRVGAGFRADLRLENSIVFFPPVGKEFPQLAEVANNANVSAAGWIEVPLRRWPVTFAARYERSLTSLGFDIHDQAVIVEAGFELR